MIRILWSNVNQAYFVMWNETVLSIQPTKRDAESWLDDRGIKKEEIFFK